METNKVWVAPVVDDVGDAPKRPIGDFRMMDPPYRLRFDYAKTPDEHMAKAVAQEMADRAHAEAISGETHDAMKWMLDAQAQVLAMLGFDEPGESNQSSDTPDAGDLLVGGNLSDAPGTAEDEQTRIARIWAAVESIARGE